MSKMEAKSHTAIHIVKGAAVKILGVKWSASAYSNDSHGGLAVQIDRKPTDEEIKLIEDEANKVIKNDQKIEIHVISKKDAEARWGDNIYDLFPIPPELTMLTIFHLPGWNVNTCGKHHTETTGEIGKIKIVIWRFRAQKQLLELSFDVEE